MKTIADLVTPGWIDLLAQAIPGLSAKTQVWDYPEWELPAEIPYAYKHPLEYADLPTTWDELAMTGEATHRIVTRHTIKNSYAMRRNFKGIAIAYMPENDAAYLEFTT